MPNGKELKVHTNHPNVRLNESEMKKLKMNMRSNSNIVSLPKLKTGRNKPTLDPLQHNGSLGYDAFFQTPQYHIINGKEEQKNKIEIITNNYDFYDNKFKKYGGNVRIGKFSTRKSIVDPKNILCDSRFDKIDVSPKIFSKSSYTAKLNF